LIGVATSFLNSSALGSGGVEPSDASSASPPLAGQG
jgi:hypothetical protein